MIDYDMLWQLNAGDRVKGPKSSFGLVQHPAIYLGNNNFIENKFGYGVRVVSANTFFNENSKVTIADRFISSWGYTSFDVVNYALSKIGTKYHATKYNCEHFANDVQYKRVESKQADIGKAIGVTAFTVLLAWGLNNNSNKQKRY